MTTDSERREVARRLRRSRSEWFGMGWRLWLGPKFCAVVLSDGNRDELEDAAHRLADLIEPSDSAQTVAEDMFGQMRHSTEQERIAYADMMARNSVELHPVDRDALLELADEIHGLVENQEIRLFHVVQVHESTLATIERRIREALGVES